MGFLKASFLFVIFLIFVNSAFSQTDFDSAIINLRDKPDSVKIRSLNEYSLKLRGVKPALSLRFAETAKDIAEKGGYKSLLAESINMIGIFYRIKGDLTKAMTYHQTALSLAKEVPDKIQIAYSYNNISFVYNEVGNYSSALENVVASIKIFEEMKFDDGLAFAFINFGNIYYNQRIFPEAIKIFQRALEIRKRKNDSEGIGQVLNSIAHAYIKMNKEKEALDTYFEAEKYFLESNNKRGLGLVWNGIARILTSRNDLPSAIEYRRKSLDLFNQLGFIDELVVTNGQLGILYAETKNQFLGNKYIQNALKLLPQIKSPEIKSELFRMAAEFYEKTNNNDSAFYYYKIHMQIKDSIQTNSNISKFAELEALYLNDKIMSQNRVLLKDAEASKKQNLYLVLIITLVIFLAIGTYSRSRSVRSTNKKLNELNGMKDTFFRIIAHDLKSPFNAVFGYLSIIKSDFKNLSSEEILYFINSIDGAINKSYQLLEQLLMWSRSNTGKLEFAPRDINLSKLINETINLLLAPANQKGINLEFQEKDEIVIYADEEMIKTVIRNLISNGLKFTRTGGFVRVIVIKEHKNVLITVLDNGIGMTEDQRKNLFRIDKSSSTTGTKGEQGTGLGLIICKEFVEKHKGKITVESSKGEGTSFIVQLPA